MPEAFRECPAPKYGLKQGKHAKQLNPSLMKTIRIFLTLASIAGLAACDHPRTKSLDEVSDEISTQFRAQHAAKKFSTPRKLVSVRITSFDTPPGNPRPYLGIEVAWDDVTSSTGVPLIPLGDGLFGITYTDPTNKSNYSAIVHFR